MTQYGGQQAYNETNPNPYYLRGGGGYYDGLTGPYDANGKPVNYSPPLGSPIGGGANGGGSSTAPSSGTAPSGNQAPPIPTDSSGNVTIPNVNNAPQVDPALAQMITDTYNTIAQQYSTNLAAQQATADNNVRDRVTHEASLSRNRIQNNFASRGLGGSAAAYGPNAIGAVDRGELAALADSLQKNDQFYQSLKNDQLGTLANFTSNGVLGLAGKKLDAEEFARSLGLDAAKLNTQNRQFYDDLNLKYNELFDSAGRFRGDVNADKERKLKELLTKITTSSSGNQDLVQLIQSILQQAG